MGTFGKAVVSIQIYFTQEVVHIKTARVIPVIAAVVCVNHKAVFSRSLIPTIGIPVAIVERRPIVPGPVTLRIGVRPTKPKILVRLSCVQQGNEIIFSL